MTTVDDISDDNALAGTTETLPEGVSTEVLEKFFSEERKKQAREKKLRELNKDPEKVALLKRLQAEEDAKQAAAEAIVPAQAAAPVATLPPPEFHYAEVFKMDPATKTPNGYKVNQGGVFVQQQTPAGEQWPRICLAPLVITAAYIDARGEQSVELAWRSRGTVVRRLVPRGLIRRGRKLIEVLGSVGLPVIESDARAVERWLGEFELANIKTLRSTYVARHLGWQPDGSFVAGPQGDTYVAPLYDDQERAATAYQPKGSPGPWRAAVAKLEPHPAARAVVAAAFAPVLLAEFDEPSFMLDISFRSTSGKTTCVRCAMSAWADPSERGGAISPWDTTALAMEKKLNLVRGLPSALDDTMLAKDPALVGDTPYRLSMDRGRSRGGDYPSGLEWQTILLSTGERSVLSYTKGQGASVRALTLMQRPLGEGAGALAEELAEVTAENYGHAGPEFARRFRTLLSDKALAAKLKARRDEIKALLRGDTAMTGRRAPKIALLALAEELACDWGILPYQPLRIDQWQRLFTENVDESDDRSEQAMEIVRGHVASNYASLYDSQALTAQTWQAGEVRVPLGGWLGVVRRPRGGGAPRIALQPQRVREILRRAEIEYDAVLQGWLELGYLEQTAKSGKPYLINVKVGKAGAKHLVFTESAIPYDPPEDD